MAREVKLTKRAAADIESIWQYIARDSESYASLVAASIMTAAEDLSEYPRIGERIEQVAYAEIREVPVYPYRLFYAVEETTIWVLAIAHGARHLDQKFFDRLL